MVLSIAPVRSQRRIDHHAASVIIQLMMTQSTKTPTLGILQCGHSPDKIIEQYGPYDNLFKQLLGPDAFNYQTYTVLDGVFPSSIDAADAWLITGSKHGVYEPLPWIAPLEEFVRTAFAAKMPMVGICFGHQLLTQALGGKVEKFSGGWIAGTREYQLDAETGLESAVLNAWHQDQVVELPENARALGSSDGCQYAAIAFSENTVSLQPHPEFENDYVEILLQERGDALPADSLQIAAASIGHNLTNKPIADWLRNVLYGNN